MDRGLTSIIPAIIFGLIIITVCAICCFNCSCCPLYAQESQEIVQNEAARPIMPAVTSDQCQPSYAVIPMDPYPQQVHSLPEYHPVPQTCPPKHGYVSPFYIQDVQQENGFIPQVPQPLRSGISYPTSSPPSYLPTAPPYDSPPAYLETQLSLGPK